MIPDEVNDLIEEIIESEDSDIEKPKFSHLVKELLNGELKYNVFAKMYPDHSCYDMFIRLENIGTHADYLKHPSQYNGKWYGNGGHYGAEICIYSGKNNLWSCISETSCRRKQPGDELILKTRMKTILNLNEKKTCGSLAIYLSYLNHAGMLWVDKQNKQVDRYDPYYCGVKSNIIKTKFDREQIIIDIALKEFFREMTPNFEYKGNVLSEMETIQKQRSNFRKYSDNFCQDYGILYAIRRIHGMSNIEAASHMVSMKSYILEDIRQLLQQMWCMEHLHS